MQANRMCSEYAMRAAYVDQSLKAQLRRRTKNGGVSAVCTVVNTQSFVSVALVLRSRRRRRRRRLVFAHRHNFALRRWHIVDDSTTIPRV